MDADLSSIAQGNQNPERIPSQYGSTKGVTQTTPRNQGLSVFAHVVDDLLFAN